MKKKRDLLSSLGIVLGIAGISCMGVVKGLIGSNIQMLSIGIVVLTVILLLKGQKLGYIAQPTADVGLIFLYSVVTLMMSLISGIPVMTNGYGFIYQAALFLEILLLWNINEENDTDLYVEVGFWFCGGFCLILLLLLIENSSGSLFINSFTSDDGEYLFNRSTIGALSFRSFALSIAYRPNSVFKKQIRIFILLASLVVVVVSSRRGVYLATIACILLHYRNTRERISSVDIDRLVKKLIVVGAVVIILLMVCSKLTFVQEALSRAWKMLVDGVQTFLGISNSDMSATMRVSKLQVIVDQLLNYSTPMQILHGRGYMTTWIDVPYVQAFWDLGLTGGIVYCIIQFVIPFRYLAKKARTPGVMAAQYLVALSTVEGLVSGYPYGRFFMIVLLITMDTINQKSFEQNLPKEYKAR